MNIINIDQSKLQEKQTKAVSTKIKNFGKELVLSDGSVYKVSFTKSDQDGMIAINEAFKSFGLKEANFTFSNGTKILFTPSNFKEVATFFVAERQKFFN